METAAGGERLAGGHLVGFWLTRLTTRSGLLQCLVDRLIRKGGAMLLMVVVSSVIAGLTFLCWSLVRCFFPEMAKVARQFLIATFLDMVL